MRLAEGATEVAVVGRLQADDLGSHERPAHRDAQIALDAAAAAVELEAFHCPLRQPHRAANGPILYRENHRVRMSLSQAARVPQHALRMIRSRSAFGSWFQGNPGARSARFRSGDARVGRRDRRTVYPALHRVAMGTRLFAFTPPFIRERTIHSRNRTEEIYDVAHSTD